MVKPSNEEIEIQTALETTFSMILTALIEKKLLTKYNIENRPLTYNFYTKRAGNIILHRAIQEVENDSQANSRISSRLTSVIEKRKSQKNSYFLSSKE